MVSSPREALQFHNSFKTLKLPYVHIRPSTNFGVDYKLGALGVQLSTGPTAGGALPIFMTDTECSAFASSIDSIHHGKYLVVH